MIEWWLLWIPIAIAILNRYRGGNEMGKGYALALMVLVGGIATPNLYFLGGWVLFILLYAVGPWQAMFSAITGNAPSRKDSWAWQWMQDLAHWICGNNWIFFGCVYGAIRGGITLIAVALFCYFTRSWIPLIGLGMLGMGIIYWWVAKIMTAAQAITYDVPGAEEVIGWFIGTYMLVVRAAMPVDLLWK